MSIFVVLGGEELVTVTFYLQKLYVLNVVVIVACNQSEVVTIFKLWCISCENF